MSTWDEEWEQSEERGTQHIRKQVERILDEGSGERRQVIVRLRAPADVKRSLITLAADAIQQRNMALTARDVLPPAMDPSALPPFGRRSSSQRQTVVDRARSMTARASARSIDVETMGGLKSDGLEKIAPFVQSSIVRQWAQESATASKRRPRDTFQTFWTSKSVLLELSETDLMNLPTVPLVRDVYPNRALRSPRLVAVSNLPTSVLEVKSSSWGVHQIGALAVWGAYGVKGEGVTVGLLDTGIDASHPDLKGKIAAWAEFDVKGNRVKGSKPHDTDQHGTHCGGTIVGGRESGSWIGVAPESKLKVALVLDGESGGTDAQILAGLDWLCEEGVDVISMSLGGLTLDHETPNTYTEAILTCLRAGIPVVTAIGNDGGQTTGSPGNDIYAYAVGATDYRDKPAGFSGGRTHVIRASNLIPPHYLPMPYSKPDVSAPGVAINSSVPGGKWAAFNGTSMAAPHVAGAIALLLSATNIKNDVPASRRAFLLQDLLSGSAEELGESGPDHRFGFGRIDVLRAIGFAGERGYGLP